MNDSKCYCPVCDSQDMEWAAPLGNLWHACCRACGMVYTFTWEVDDVGCENTEGSACDVC
jgi:hypothetical protein